MVLTLVVILSAAPLSVDLVERNSIGLSSNAASQYRERLRQAMAKEGLDVAMSGESCAGVACLMKLASASGHCVVGVTLVKGKRGVTVDLEAVDGERVLLQQTFTVSDKLEQSPEVQVFARQLVVRLTPDEKPVVAQAPPAKDAPVRDRPLELPERTKPQWVEEEPPRSAAPTVVLVSGAVVAAAGVAMVVAGAVSGATLEQRLQAPVVMGLTRPQAQAQADGANALMGAGVAASVVGAGALITGLALR